MPTVVVDQSFETKAKKLHKKYPGKVQKVKKTIIQLEADPWHPGLRTKKYDHDRGIWQSYVEHRTPSAWRLWWMWSPSASDTIIVIGYGPQP